MPLFDDPTVPLSQALPYLINNPSVSGFPVTRQTVMGLPAFRRAVQLIASAVARLDLDVIKERPDGGKEKFDKHPAYKLLRYRPCDFYPPFLLKQAVMLDVLTNGQAFVAVERDGFGVDPTGLVRLDPSQVQVILVNGALGYVWKVPGYDAVPILADDMLHFRNIGDGVNGISIIDSMKTALGLAGATQQFASEYYRWSASPTMILEVPVGFKNPEELEKLAADVESKHCGLTKSHRVMVLRNGMKMSDWKISAQDAALIESRQMTLVDIANIVGISPNRLGAAVNTSYGSLEAEQRAFLVHDLEPFLVMIEQECSKLLKDDEVGNGVCVEFDRTWMELPDAATQSKIDMDEVNNGLKSVNEKRAERNEPRINEEWADEYRMPATIVYAGPAFDTQEAAEDVAEATAPEDPAEDAAEEQAEAPQPGGDQAEAEAAPAEDYRERFETLLAIDLERQLVRLRKAVESHGNRPGLDLTGHRNVYRQALPFLADRLDSIADELEAVLPEQRAAVLDNLKRNICSN